MIKKETLNKNKVLLFFVKLIALGLFSGKVPNISGTAGSFVAVLLCIPFIKLSFYTQILILILMLVLGSLSIRLYLKYLGNLKKDPKEVVVDEIFAIFMITFIAQYFTNIFQIKHFIAIFVIFRFFDILKPFPISYVDKNIHGAKGIMLDDILAGLATILVYIILFY